MTNEALKLKRLLNSIPDSELDAMELWIDNEKLVELFALDDNAITLITDKSKVKINDMEW